MPLEKTLGQVIKIVYLHGALSRAGMIGVVHTVAQQHVKHHDVLMEYTD